MKRILIFLAVIFVFIVFSACSKKSDSSEESINKTIIYSLSEDEYIQGLAIGTTGSGYEFLDNTPFLMNAGTPLYTIVAHPSGKGNAIQLTDRAQNYYALDIFFDGLDLTSGPQYVIDVYGTAKPGVRMELGRTDAPWSMLSSINSSASGEWHIHHELSNAELMDYFAGSQRGARIMSVPYADFIVNEIIVTRIGERGTVFILPEWDFSLPSLAKAYEGYFLIGNIWSNYNSMIAYDTMEGFLHHFNAITAENSHKPSAIAPGGYNRPAASAFIYSDSSDVINWAVENNLALTGHALVWHNQSPPWLTESAQGVPLTRSEARENMEFYIRTISEYYNELGMLRAFNAWDVVNEAMATDGGTWGASLDDWYGGDWRTQLRRDSPWFLAYANGYNESAGEHPSDYIYDAFVFARKYFPYSTLYYNDYNEEVPAKRNAIAQMTEQINSRWSHDSRNNPEAVSQGRQYTGRKLIEGIGLQSHYHLDQWRTNFDYIRPALERYIATGAVLSITELDITVGGQGGINPATLPVPMSQADMNRQAHAYARLFGYYLEFADHIERVSFWGKLDHQSWRAWGQPLLFDENIRAKPAFHAIIDLVNSNKN